MCASRFLLEPMKLCAASLGQCFRLFFKEVPLQWQPVLFITGVCLFVLFILTHAGLEIWTPLLRLGFKPRVNVEAIENDNRRLLADNQNMRRQIEQFNKAAIPVLSAPLQPHNTSVVQAIEEVGERVVVEPRNGNLLRGGNQTTAPPQPKQPIERVGGTGDAIVNDGVIQPVQEEEFVSMVRAMELTATPETTGAAPTTTTINTPREIGATSSNGANEPATVNAPVTSSSTEGASGQEHGIGGFEIVNRSDGDGIHADDIVEAVEDVSGLNDNRVGRPGPVEHSDTC